MKLMVNRKMIDDSPVGNKIVNDGDGRLGVEKLQLEGSEPGERVCVGLVVAACPRPGLPRACRAMSPSSWQVIKSNGYSI